MRFRLFVVMVLAPVLLCTAGCATAKSKALQAKLLTMARNPAVEADYRIAPPDSLAIEVSGYPEYSRSVTVRPDGRITVAPVGDVSVQGLTTTEAAKAVEDALLKELSQPRVTISLLAANSKAIYVLGEVRRQGRQPYYGDMTLIDVLGQAAGTTLNADVGKIKVTRASLDAPEVILINLRKLVYDGAAEQNIIIKEGDIVYVPPTGWAKVGYAVNQVLFPFRSGISAVSTYNTVDDAFDGNND